MYLKLKNGEKTISYKLAKKILKSSYYLRVGEYYLEIADNERNSYDNRVYMTNRNGEKYFIQPMSLFIENPSENIGDFIKSHRGLKFDGKKINDFSDIPNYTGTLQIVEPVFNDEAKNQKILGLKISGFLHFEGTTELNIFKYFGDYNNFCDVIDIRGFTFDTGLTSTNSMFRSAKVEQIRLDGLDVSKVTDMSGMFASCPARSLGLTGLNTSNVTDMSIMFAWCHYLTNLDLSSFDTSNVTNMRSMFQECIGLTSLNLSSFDTSKVTDMAYMFYVCGPLTNLDLSSFDTRNVTNMSSMFYGCGYLTSLDLSNFNTSNVTNMGYMFGNCSRLASLDLSNFDTSNVTNMDSMFFYCESLTNVDLSGNIVTRETVEKICTELKRSNSDHITVYVSDSSKHEGLSFARITFAYK